VWTAWPANTARCPRTVRTPGFWASGAATTASAGARRAGSGPGAVASCSCPPGRRNNRAGSRPVGRTAVVLRAVPDLSGADRFGTTTAAGRDDAYSAAAVPLR